MIRSTRGNVGCDNYWELEGAEGTVGKSVSRSLEVHTNIPKSTELKTLGSTTTLVPRFGAALNPSETDAQGRIAALKHGAPAPPGLALRARAPGGALLLRRPLDLLGPLLDGLGAWRSPLARDCSRQNAEHIAPVCSLVTSHVECLHRQALAPLSAEYYNNSA